MSRARPLTQFQINSTLEHRIPSSHKNAMPHGPEEEHCTNESSLTQPATSTHISIDWKFPDDLFEDFPIFRRFNDRWTSEYCSSAFVALLLELFINFIADRTSWSNVGGSTEEAWILSHCQQKKPNLAINMMVEETILWSFEFLKIGGVGEDFQFFLNY